MVNRSIGKEIRKPIQLSVILVDVGVADVEILFRAEIHFDLIEPMLQHGECDGDAVFHPHALLRADRAVGTTADNVSQRLSFAHPRHGDAARRVAGLERSVYVKTDELRQDYPYPNLPPSKLICVDIFECESM